MFPDAPTLEELGLKGFDAGTSHGFWAPAGTPAPIIERLNREINQTMTLPAVTVTDPLVSGLDCTPANGSVFKDKFNWTLLVW